MKRFSTLLLLVSLCLISCNLRAQITKKITGIDAVIEGKYSSIPDYIGFSPEAVITYSGFLSWINQNYALSDASNFKVLSSDSDNLGFIHYRLQQTVNNRPVESTMYILHTKNGRIISMNGQLLNNIDAPSLVSISETDALSYALKFINASAYKWESVEAEKTLQQTTNNASATFYPKGELVYVAEQGNIGAKKFHLAYKFDVYAVKPLSRNYVYVDAVSGEIVHSVNRIETSNAPATAHTGYSGIQTITTDSFNGSYRLQESGRGNGIITLNAQTTTNVFNAVDFSNPTTTWNNVNAALDQYATDAHLASEATFDFYNSKFNRNSIDNAGFTLTAFVHYDVRYQNAFWDGSSMNYGDGINHPFTSLEVGGHEISHGLTQYTANLNYRDESGGLNESFSDCMGISIRQFIQQASTVDYKVGDQIGSAFRSMANPKLYAQPNTYLGYYWAPAGGPDNGGVHTNSGVQNYWFYLVAHGGSGTNDNGKSYNITGINIDKAAAITFRNLTVYLTPSSQYADARTYSIQAAIDLYGACSQEVKTVTNAWYAVGIGDSSGAIAGFTQDATTACSIPSTFAFTSTSNNATHYSWDFGDNTAISNAHNPSHVYSAYGNYTVKLSVSNSCGLDSIIKVQLIHINNVEPVVLGHTICAGQTASLSANSIGPVEWYTSAVGGSPIYSGTSFNTPLLNNTTTYYAQTNIPGYTSSCGAIDNSYGNGGNYTGLTVHSLIFNCLIKQTLLSVDVYANGTSNRTIVLQDNTGNQLHSVTVNIPDGQSTVNLNIPLPVGNGLRLSIGGNVNLYRNTTGSYYPNPSTDSTVIITNSDGGSMIYNYFYNWQLEQYPCISNRIPVQVVILNTRGSFLAHAIGTSINFASNAVGTGVNYHWDFGDGNNSSTQNPSHVYSNYGTYIVKLIESNGTCSDTIIQTVALYPNGISEVKDIADISIFPNPVPNILNIKISVPEGNDFRLDIEDLLGQTILSQNIHLNSGSNELAVDVSAFYSGSYFVSIVNGQGIKTKIFIKT